MVIDELSGDELLFHRLFHCLASSSLSSLSSFLHASLSLFLLRRWLPQQLSTQSLLASVKLRKWINEDSQMFCVLVHSVENEGRVEESQDKLTGEFRSDSGFVLEDVSLNKQRHRQTFHPLTSLLLCLFSDSCWASSGERAQDFLPSPSLFLHSSFPFLFFLLLFLAPLAW